MGQTKAEEEFEQELFKTLDEDLQQEFEWVMKNKE